MPALYFSFEYGMPACIPIVATLYSKTIQYNELQSQFTETPNYNQLK